MGVLLTKEQEAFHKSLIANPKASPDLPNRYLKAILNRVVIPDHIADYSFDSLEDAFLSLINFEECMEDPEASGFLDFGDIAVMKYLEGLILTSA